MLLITLISKSAATAMLLTTFIPGGGQFYTHRWLKGIAIGGIQTYILYKGVKIQLDINETNRKLDISMNNSLSDRRDKLLIERREIIWWGALVWTLGILDAYVDAQLYNFEGDISLDRRGNPRISLSINIHY